MKRINGFIHNCITEVVVLICICVILIACTVCQMLINPDSSWFALVVVGLFWGTIFFLLITIVSVARNLVLNRKHYYLDCNRSFFRHKYVWINQCFKLWRPKDKCPQKEFVREMLQILKDLPEGTVCYCCTHEDIVKQIKKKFPDAKCTEAYKKDLKKLKKYLKSLNCKSCKSKTCSLMQSKNTQFYSVEFIR